MLIIHFAVYLYVKPKPGEPEGKRWMDRLTEKEYQKALQRTRKPTISNEIKKSKEKKGE